MIVTLVHIWVKPESHEDFIKASLKNHEASIKESGNLRFDLIQDIEDENKFVFYEAYETEADIEKHKDTSHYKLWRDTVVEMMAQPRKGIKHRSLSPLEKSK